jgi:hypothetical protein
MTDGKPHLEVVRDESQPPPEIVGDTTASLAEAESSLRRRVILFVSLFAAIAVAFSLWTRWRGNPIAQMPRQERYALYVKTLDHFAHVCEDQQLADNARALCADEADFLRRFPDCNQECLDRTSPFVHEHPTR